MLPPAVDKVLDAAHVRKAVPKRLPIPPALRKEWHLKYNRHPLVIEPPKANSAYRRTFRVLLRNPAKTDRFDDLILKYSAKYKLDPRLMKSIIAAESEFTPEARSPKGALGLMQVMPITAEGHHVPRELLTDPESNIRAGTAYLDYLFRLAWKKYKLKGVRYHDAPVWVVQRVIASYHAGPRFIYRHRFFRSTRRYVRKVLLFYQSGVTDIRRPPEADASLPKFELLRSTSGAF